MNPEQVKGIPLGVPKHPDKLFLRNLGAIQPKHDPSKPVKNCKRIPIDRKKFKELPFDLQPSNPLEQSYCSRVLTPESLQHIAAGP